jgi:hypothetical protein
VTWAAAGSLRSASWRRVGGRPRLTAAHREHVRLPLGTGRAACGQRTVVPCDNSHVRVFYNFANKYYIWGAPRASAHNLPSQAVHQFSAPGMSNPLGAFILKVGYIFLRYFLEGNGVKENCLRCLPAGTRAPRGPRVHLHSL